MSNGLHERHPLYRSRGAVLPGVLLHLTTEDSSGARSATSDESGRFGFFLLRPGTYELHASNVDFKSVTQRDIHVPVAETLRIELHLELATRIEQTQVSAQPLMVQLDTSALGRIANQETISSLPLATRNFAQLAGLSPGVTVGVYLSIAPRRNQEYRNTWQNLLLGGSKTVFYGHYDI